MVGSEVNVSLIVIRGLAAVLFLVFFAKSCERRHIVLTLGWTLYATSGALRLIIHLDPIRYWNLVGLTSVGAIALIMLAAVSYLKPRVLRFAVPTLILFLAPAPLILHVEPNPVIGVLFYIAQGLFLALPVIVYHRDRREARRLFSFASRFLTIVLSVSVVYVFLVAFVDFEPLAKAVGTAIINAILLSFFVYTEHELVLDEARRTDRRFRHAEEAVGIGIWERDGFDGEAWWSPGHYRIFGLPFRTGVGPSWEEYLTIVSPDDRTRVRDAFAKAIRDGKIGSISYRIVRPDKEVRWISSHAVTREGSTSFGLIVDITSLKKTEEELERSLEEKDTLLAELHHRVKNNLQLISSMLRLQFDTISDPAVRELVERTDDRLQIMSEVQEHLLEMPDLSKVRMDQYLGVLTEYTTRIVPSPSGQVHVDVDTNGICLDAAVAVVVGLIVVELLSNAIQHAFTRLPPGVVGIELERRGAAYRLSVSDDGIGIRAARPATVKRENTVPLGLTLVESLVSQLNGAMTFHGENGTRVEIDFPMTFTEGYPRPVAEG